MDVELLYQQETGVPRRDLPVGILYRPLCKWVLFCEKEGSFSGAGKYGREIYEDWVSSCTRGRGTKFIQIDRHPCRRKLCDLSTERVQGEASPTAEIEYRKRFWPGTHDLPATLILPGSIRGRHTRWEGSTINKPPKLPTVGESLKAYSSDCLIKNELDGLLGHFLRDRLKVGHHLSLDSRSSIILNVT